MAQKQVWEELDSVDRDREGTVRTQRTAVPGGWIVRTVVVSERDGNMTACMVFVPDSGVKVKWKPGD